MAQSMSADEKIALIKANLQEVLKPEIIEDVINKQDRPLAIYWGSYYVILSLHRSTYNVGRHGDDWAPSLRLLCSNR